MRRIVLIFAVSLLAAGCTSISALLGDDEVVAKVGKDKLYRSEVERYIPDYASPEDSATLARQYINSWASELLYVAMASEKLSKSEMDVTRELEDFRRSLLKFRYQQKYISTRLDTLVTAGQIEEYYDSHSEELELPRPILKVRFVEMMKNSPYKDDILQMMSDSDNSSTSFRDSIALSSALRYFDNSETWMDAAVLAREFRTDASFMVSRMKDSFIVIEHEDSGELLAAYVCDIRMKGKAPIEYCTPHIKDVILSERKHQLMTVLEQDLMNDAVKHRKIVIYDEDR